ncbi:MAG: FlgD immunoglobulin-like domain containing protein, partial [Candidatus Latescibacterota bacterium]
NKKKLVDVTFTPAVARYVRVQVKAVDNVHRVQISEIEVYGEGYLSSGTFTSSVTDLGAARAKNIGRVTWRAEKPKGTELSLAFRTGPTSTPDDRWSDWWGPASADSSALPVLPEPRRYLQYRVTMATTNPSATPRLTGIQLIHGEPLAQTATATVVRDAAATVADTLPANQVPVGVSGDFLATVQVTMGTGTGFDRLRLLLPNRGQVQKVWQEGSELEAGTDYTTASDTTSLEIRLAARVSTNTQFQVRFASALFDDANVFRGQLVADDQSDNPQELDAAASGALTVYTTGLIDQVLDWGRVQVTPNPFTPNGDGRSDTAMITYELAKLGVARQVVLGLFDLSGRQVRRFEMHQKSGQHVVEWDGRDDGGNRVPPGLYLFRLDVDSDKPVELCGTIAVAY